MKFTDSHEWAKLEDSKAYVGITPHAKQELGEVVYIELPKLGAILEAGDEAVIVESTKAASDIYSPLSGKVVEVNEAIQKDPKLLDEEKGDWLFVLEDIDLNEYENLLDFSDYEALIS